MSIHVQLQFRRIFSSEASGTARNDLYVTNESKSREAFACLRRTQRDINDIIAKEGQALASSPGPRCQGLNHQHNFANMFAGFDPPVRVCDPFEPEPLSISGLNRPSRIKGSTWPRWR